MTSSFPPTLIYWVIIIDQSRPSVALSDRDPELVVAVGLQVRECLHHLSDVLLRAGHRRNPAQTIAGRQRSPEQNLGWQPVNQSYCSDLVLPCYQTRPFWRCRHWDWRGSLSPGKPSWHCLPSQESRCSNWITESHPPHYPLSTAEEVR